MSAVGIPSDRIAVELNGRRYGLDEPMEEKFLQAVPGSFQELGTAIRKQSALLAVQPGPGLDKQAVFDAYAADLALLERQMHDFECCVKQAIRCSIITRQHAEEATAEAAVEKTWQVLTAEIPPLGKVPLIQLPYTRAAKPPDALLRELQEEFGDAVQRVLKLFSFWCHRLVEKELVGLVEWADLDVCRYHYFRHERTEAVLSEQRRVDRTVERNSLWGPRTEERTIRERTVRSELFHERRVHHIVSARLHALDDYRGPVPNRVRAFLDAAPAWLRPLLQVVEGQMTMEEILRQKKSEATGVETQVTAVYKYCPGVLLAPFNLIGWSADELAEPTRRGRVGASIVRALSTEIGWILGIGLLAVSALVASRAGAIGLIPVGLGAAVLGFALYGIWNRSRN